MVDTGCVKQFGCLALVILCACSSQPDSLAHKALKSEAAASHAAGGFTTGQKRLYHLGLQHIYHTHGQVGSFTIAQVINSEQSREDARQALVEHAREAAAAAKQRAEAEAAAAKQRARDEAAAAEEANYIHGNPDCLVLDKRTLTTESGDETWYILGKVTNRCDRDLAYAQVEFNFYDSDGNQDDSGLVNVNNLASGDTWSFKKPVYETTSDGGRWRVAGLSGW